MKVKEKTIGLEHPQNKSSEVYTLFLHNDDVNTFEFVIQALVEVCRQDENQAEQCAIITHFKGKCDIKRGSLPDLEPMMNELHRRGLSASINLN